MKLPANRRGPLTYNYNPSSSVKATHCAAGHTYGRGVKLSNEPSS